ncbi:T9SS-dependent M36 family metallopeptidase [Epilithonimonas pallida]|uniref:Por secretion system C-terminal sorting domain-containing protein n=1 Tax=Epilithonimonas pallida TaxID=373671 RepID=A0ABY1R3A9_9FLAO|nr:T9SS-dependent M36 family metallopeptidase [Epilithonimonas pallida]SMP93249.1 Por secretion system C-terminal sorting domain-containing protein [Epilithonimonas pallida]
MKKRKLPLIVAVVSLLTVNSVFGQNYKSVIENYLKTSVGKNAVNKDFLISSEDPSKSLNATVVKIQQTYNGIPVFGNSSTILIRDNSVLNFTGDFTSSVARSSNISQVQDVATILTKVVENLKLPNAQVYNASLGTSEIKTPALVYYDNGSDLVLSYEIEFYEQKSSNLWHIIADAKTGKIYDQNNLTNSCNFAEEAYGREHNHNGEVLNHTVAYPQNNSNKGISLLANNASYRVFPFPVEAPTFGDRSLLTNPWDLSASSLGWQNDNTTEYNITRGNNVHTYLDEGSTNAIGASADGGTSHIFDFPFDPANGLESYKNASITNLFYVNNRVHDVLYKFGFTETSKNFQAYNFGKGGSQNDYVLAEARDGAGVADLSLGYYNNANFSTPSDGSKPRMQMYIWLGAQPYFSFNGPSSVAGTSIPSIGLGYFGTPLWKQSVTGDVAISPILDACTALPAGSLTGKIGIAQRGTCNFILKVKNIQDAGAIGAIIYNSPDAATNPGEAISNMSGDGTTPVTIPSVFLPQSRGEAINALINGGQNVNVTLKIPVKDGSLDNGIISHEYGHGLSTRLTGTSVSCLSSSADKEQMGEGWSDFLALMLTMKPTDNASVARGIGTYATDEPTTGDGIRPAKYSPDTSINSYTYGDTNGMEYTNSSGALVPDVHSIGFVWATILWDLHWKYVEKYGFNNDITADANSGSARVFQAVVDGLKLQGCYPTFIMGRDAIIAADQASTGGSNKCLIWNTFAKRGVGVNASAGSKTNINDQVEDFTVPAECALATNEVTAAKGFSIYPNPAKNEFYLNFKNNILGKVNVEIYDASGKLVSNQQIDPSAREAINTQKLPNGAYVVKASGIGLNYSSKMIINK